MDVSLNSVTYGELACSEESSGENTKEITIDEVLKFIEENGKVYNYKIKKALENFENRGTPIEEIVNRRRSMYERLSKL